MFKLKCAKKNWKVSLCVFRLGAEKIAIHDRKDTVNVIWKFMDGEGHAFCRGRSFQSDIDKY
jgi:hypothetical protein